MVALLHFFLASRLTIVTFDFLSFLTFSCKIVTCNAIWFFVVNTRPSFKELYRYIVPRYYPYWKMLGILLGLRCSTLEIIEVNEHVDGMCCKEMLKQWLETDPEASWKKLLEVIKNIINEDIIM